jgi:hypothetical protein
MNENLEGRDVLAEGLGAITPVPYFANPGRRQRGSAGVSYTIHKRSDSHVCCRKTR